MTDLHQQYTCYRGGLVCPAGRYRGWALHGAQWRCVSTGPSADSCRRLGAQRILLHPLEPDPPPTTHCPDGRG